MSGEEDSAFMRQALELAREGWGRVAPNPMTGAVIVRDGDIVGRGHHAEFGGPHAEIVALREAGDEARNATLYVTLEPCHHRGKTGPCSRTIAEAAVRRVVYGIPDPNPDAGGGASWLRARGLEVEGGVCEQEVRELNAAHIARFCRDRPFVALKYALSLDGRLSEEPGTPTVVTSDAAIREAHRLRAGHDVVMVGVETVLADDPQLTVREWGAPRRPPTRVVLDSDLRTPPESRLAATSGDGAVWVIAGAEGSEERAWALQERGIEILRVPRRDRDGKLDLNAVLATLRARDVHSVLCEGGGELGSALLRAGVVDRMYLLFAPKLFGQPGVPAFQGARGAAPRDWQVLERRCIGPVTLLVLSAGALDISGG